MGLLVDQLDALLRQVLELAPEVGHLVGDVVHAGPAIRQELADRRLLPERCQELDPAVADTHRGRLHSLGLDGVAALELGAKKPLIRVYGLVEILDGEPQMVNPLRLHGEADAIRCYLGSDCSEAPSSMRFRGTTRPTVDL